MSFSEGGNNLHSDRKSTRFKVLTTRRQPNEKEFSTYSKYGKKNMNNILMNNMKNSNPISPNLKSIIDHLSQ